MDPNDDREFEANEDDEEEEPRHPNDLSEVLPPEQELPLGPFVNEHHHHANTPSGQESLMQRYTGKRKLTGEEGTSDSRKRQQLTNMVSGSSSTRPYSQMPRPPYQYPALNQSTNRLPPQPPYQYPTLNQTTNRLPRQPPYQYPTTNRLPQPPFQYPTLNQTTNGLPPLPDQLTLYPTTNLLPLLLDQYPTPTQTTNRLPQLPDQYPTLHQTTNGLPPLPDQLTLYPTTNLLPLLLDQYPTPTQTTNRLAPQPPYQYPTLNQTTNRQQDSISQRGLNAAASLQQITQSQGRNQHSAPQHRQRMVNQNSRRYQWMVNQNQNLSGQTPVIPQDGTIVGRNHSNQPPRMQQGLPPRRPDMNQQTLMGINPDPFYLRFCQEYFGGQAGTIDQQHSGPPMNIQEPSPDTALLPEMNQQMQQWQFQIQPQGFSPGESSNQGEQMQPQVPTHQIQHHGVNVESHLTNEEESMGENEI